MFQETLKSDGQNQFPEYTRKLYCIKSEPTVFFEAGVVILIPLAFGLAKKTKKSTLYYVIPLLAGLATGFAFIPPSA